MQVLDVSGNALGELGADAFRSVGLINLQRIFMREARVKHVHRDAFRDLIILVEVDLSDNEVSRLDPETFLGNDRLRVLLLAGNPLGQLGPRQFPPLPHLRTIDLQRCRLDSVHRDAFANVGALEALDLRRNRLRELSEAVFMSTGRLNTLQLDGNPWRCDCRLRGFRNWFLSSRLRSVPLTCAEPQEVAGRRWDALPASEFACAPAVTLAETLVRAEVGGNVSFACNVKGDPEPEVTWFYNGRAIGSVNSSAGQESSTSMLVIEVEEGLLEKWTNISVLNVSDTDAGEYSCVATNSHGAVSRNVTLLLPHVVTATTLSKHATPYAIWVGAACGAIAAVVVAVAAVIAACCSWRRSCRTRRGKRHRRKGGGVKGSVSFSDQEKKLLDVSITTTDRDAASQTRGSCELLQAELELLEQAPSNLELCGAGVVPSPSVGSSSAEAPVHITIESHHRGHQASAVEDPCTLPVAVFPPPPPEFSTSVLPAGAFGNIFISVSVSQDPGRRLHSHLPHQHLDVATRYPDLLDMTCGRDAAAATAFSVPSAGLATLPRRQLRPANSSSAASGSGLPALPEMTSSVAAHYDNMGPRVTAGGSSTLSLPDAVAPLEEIPPPPPPPTCTPHTGEYVSL